MVCRSRFCCDAKGRVDGLHRRSDAHREVEAVGNSEAGVCAAVFVMSIKKIFFNGMPSNEYSFFDSSSFSPRPMLRM